MKKKFEFQNVFSCGCSYCSPDCLKNALSMISDKMSKSTIFGESNTIENKGKDDEGICITCKCGGSIKFELVLNILLIYPAESLFLKKKLQNIYLDKYLKSCMFCDKQETSKTNSPRVLVDDLSCLFDDKVSHILCQDCKEIPFSMLECIHCKDIHYAK
mmetsp:Transcript_32250/g.33527  ORF Transcript_32250/g.33527 Transcript_32250/m.33527 type:complete len:159 (+) Transcript_32250:10-486(+)